MKHEKFQFDTLEAVENKGKELGVNIALARDMECLKVHIQIGKHRIANRLAIQPMEGCDGTLDGKPGELTKRRYNRFSNSGAGLIWFEATAIANDGRANPHQLMLTEENLDEFKKLVDTIKENSIKKFGFAPVVIMQATHSGRYSKPHGKPEPIIVYNNPVFEGENPLPKSSIVADDRLKELEVLYGKSAELAEKAGFDGVDIKACHGYLMNESFSAFVRDGLYGGSFENRIRFFKNSIEAAKTSISTDMIVTSRMNIYDGFAYPYGWGVDKNNGIKPDNREPIKLIDILHNKMGIELLDFTIGNPYVNPHVNRPYDSGGYEAKEHPLQGVARMCECIGEIKSHFPILCVVDSGNSYLRQYSANLAAGMVMEKKADIAGFGRMAFAYPEFARDILLQGYLNPKKCCITCSKCTDLMRSGSTPGCVIRDTPVYSELYKKFLLNK